MAKIKNNTLDNNKKVYTRNDLFKLGYSRYAI